MNVSNEATIDNQTTEAALIWAPQIYVYIGLF